MTDDDTWRAATFAGNEEDQLRRFAAATPAQRLAWLEAALAMAYQSGALKPLQRERAEDDAAADPASTTG